MGNQLVSFLFKIRVFVLAFFASVSLFFLFSLKDLYIDASVEKQLPTGHAYVETMRKHEEEFGLSNKVLISASPAEGDIFSPEFLAQFQKLSDEAIYLPGVNRSLSESLFTPNVRYTEVVDGGFNGGNIVPADLIEASLQQKK